MSGGIQDIRIEDIVAINTQSGIRVKTAPGRGGYIKDIYVRNVTMQTMKYVFWMIGSYGSHADKGYNPKALPEIKNINYNDMTATDVKMSGNLADAVILASQDENEFPLIPVLPSYGRGRDAPGD
ncbi:Pectin lyase-like superfamily protein, partial [Thalictrum thalictroides]